MRTAGIDPIFLLAPTSTDERIESIARQASGYIYYVSLKGITGAGHLDVASVAEKLPLIRRHTQVPVGVGFGIRDAESAQALARVADAVVIGSRIIQEIESSPREQAAAAVEHFVAGIRAALDALPVKQAA
jgi:tryptophan synthase alpha chain